LSTLVNSVATLILIRKKWKYLILFFYFAMVMMLFFIEHINPDSVISLSDKADLFGNQVFCYCHTFVALVWLFYFINELYRKERKKLLELSITDELTGAYNRRYIFELIKKESELKNEMESYLLLIDIDNFKIVNDKYGHDRGDCVLCSLINIINGNLDKNSYAGRIGGDEFIVLFSGIGKNEMIRKTRAIMKEFSDKNGLTISVGIEKLDKNHEIGEIVRNTDKKMYEVKHNGKNDISF